MYLEQDVAYGFVHVRKCVCDGELHAIEEQPAQQRVAVGVESICSDTDQLIAVLHAMRARPGIEIDDTDNETGEVVITGLIKIGELRSLATDERASVRAATVRETC